MAFDISGAKNPGYWMYCYFKFFSGAIDYLMVKLVDPKINKMLDTSNILEINYE